VNSFDSSIISFLNGFAHHSLIFDNLVYVLDNQLLKGGVIVALIWWAWFRPGANQTKNRQYLLCGIVACLLSIVVARTLAKSLPYRERPLRNPEIHFQLPYGDSSEALIHWSAFPSDHAAVFFALATAIFFAWRAAGIYAFCHVFFIICLPRIYLGYHHPTDILGGAAVGIAIAWLAAIEPVRKAVSRMATPWLENSPGSFYAGLFIMTFEIATLFEGLRKVALFVADALKMHG
jgi:undecaprenyl-diphosphatase